MDEASRELFSIRVSLDGSDKEIERDFIVVDGVVPEDIELWIQDMVDGLLGKNEF